MGTLGEIQPSTAVRGDMAGVSVIERRKPPTGAVRHPFLTAEMTAQTTDEGPNPPDGGTPDTL